VLFLLIAELRGTHLPVEEVLVHRRFDVMAKKASLGLSRSEESIQGGVVVDRNVKGPSVEWDYFTRLHLPPLVEFSS
jgi:hypothetical protein